MLDGRYYRYKVYSDPTARRPNWQARFEYFELCGEYSSRSARHGAANKGVPQDASRVPPTKDSPVATPAKKRPTPLSVQFARLGTPNRLVWSHKASFYHNHSHTSANILTGHADGLSVDNILTTPERGVTVITFGEALSRAARAPIVPGLCRTWYWASAS